MRNFFNLKAFLKFLSRHKAYTSIEIFGLSVSFMFVILIATYIVQKLSIDKEQTKTDNVYVLGLENGFGSAYKIADRLVERYPEIEQTCVITHSKKMGEITVPIASGNQQIKASVLWADSTLQNFFDFELIAGKQNEFLTHKNYAIKSESFANKAFPQEDPIGQSIKDAQNNDLIITGVIKDIKNSVLPYADIVTRIENADYPGYSMFHTQFWNVGSVTVFLKAVSGSHLESRNEDLVNYFNEIFWVYSDGIYTDAFFTPYKDIYFSPISGEILQQGEWTFVMILIAVAFIILVFAIINYINLTVAQTGFRAKEMATRRSLLISILGLLAMSTYFIQQRLREVALRKVFGSTILQILERLTLTFIRYVLIAFVLAIPIIWYTMNDWLAGYSYRISLHPLIFMVAGGICLTISFFTVFWQSYHAATINPVENIKTE